MYICNKYNDINGKKWNDLFVSQPLVSWKNIPVKINYSERSRLNETIRINASRRSSSSMCFGAETRSIIPPLIILFRETKISPSIQISFLRGIDLNRGKKSWFIHRMNFGWAIRDLSTREFRKEISVFGRSRITLYIEKGGSWKGSDHRLENLHFRTWAVIDSKAIWRTRTFKWDFEFLQGGRNSVRD